VYSNNIRIQHPNAPLVTQGVYKRNILVEREKRTRKS